MKIYTAKIDTSATKKVVVDDMFLTKNLPTTAGSKMLDGFKSLFDAEVITRLEKDGYTLSGKADVGEFAFDVIGETSYNGAKTVNACVEILNEDVYATLNLDVNGYPRRVASQSGLISVKPTYGTVSRFGLVPVACSGETVSVMSKSVAGCKEVLKSIVGHDDKDGTSHPSEVCNQVIENTSDLTFKKVAILKSMLFGIDDGVKGKINEVTAILKANGILVEEIDDSVIKTAKSAWNILMSSELTNNVSRYDGVKYGYRANYFTNLDELYTNSRTEAFGEVLKTAILYGSDNLSTENYFKLYDKALRVRRVILEKFNELFGSYDAVIIPSVSTLAYTEEMLSEKGVAYKENFYTAPASITGLPCVALNGVQVIGKAFSENVLFNLASIIEKGGKN